MAGSIKGITIEIDGNVTPLNNSLKSVDQQTKNVQNELRQVDRLLKFDPSNVDLLAQKQKLLGNAVQSTAQRLDTLRQAQSQVEQQFAKGEIGEEAFRRFQREIIATEGKLNSFLSSAKKNDINIDVAVDDKGINRLKGAISDLGTEAARVGREIGSALSTGSAAAAAGIGALVVGSTDLNNDLARLRTNTDLAGRDLGVLEQGLSDIVTITGETDSAVETLSNLLASGFNDVQLESVIEGINGAAIRFSDTLNTEGIADGLQETFATGEAIGQFGELLERSGVDLDEFNGRLAQAKKDGTEANLVMETFASLGLNDVTQKYKELNPELVENNQATLDMQLALSNLAITLTPLVTMVTSFVTKIVEWVQSNQQLATVLGIVVGAITLISGIISVLTPIVTTAITLFTNFSAVFGALKFVLLAITGPVGIVIGIITALVTVGVLLYKNWETVKSVLSTVWSGLLSLGTKVFNSIGDVISTVFNGIVGFFTGVWDTITSVFNSAVTGISSFLSKSWDSVSKDVNKVFSNLSKFFTNIWEVIKNVFLGSLLIIVELLSGNWGRALDVTKQVFNNIKNALTNVWSAIKGVFSGTLGAISTLVSNSFNSIKNVITNVFNSVKTFISNTWNGIKSTLSSVVSSISSNISKGFSNIVSGVTSKLSSLTSAVKKIPSSVLNTLKSLPGNMRSVGSDIISGLVNGLTSGLKRVTDIARKIGNTVRGAVENILKIKSPSRVFIGIGGFVGEGLQIGLDRTINGIRSSAERLANTTLNAGVSLTDSRVRSTQANAIQQSVAQRNTQQDLTPLINAVLQLANTQPDVKLVVDGRELASTVSANQNNALSLDGLLRGVNFG